MDIKNETLELINSFFMNDNIRIEVITCSGGIKKIVITSTEKENDSLSVIEETKEAEKVETPVQKMVGTSKEETLEARVSNLLCEIGCPVSLRGYRYVREAIMMGYNNMTYIDNITKMLYPSIAKKYDSTESRVERAMRHAIEVMWLRGNQNKINELFGYTVSYKKGKPTNSEFIAMITDKLHLED